MVIADSRSHRKQLKIKRALLIYPFAVTEDYDLETVLSGGAFLEAPLGLAYIASYASKYLHDMEIEVFDSNAMAVKHIVATGRVDMDELYGLVEAKVQDFAPDIVGVSCLFHNVAPAAHKFISLVKDISAEIVTVMGGNYPAGSPEIALSDKWLDFIVFSEGEKTFVKLVECLRSGSKLTEDVDGIGFNGNRLQNLTPYISEPEHDPSGDDDFIKVPKETLTKTLDNYPWPERKNLDMGLYASYSKHFAFRTLSRDHVRIATMTASRGCPFKCSFCSSKDFWGLQIRYRDPITVVDEMEYLKDEFDINTFVFNDDNIMFNKKIVIELCNEMKRRNLNINWLSGGGIQVSSMKPDVIQALVETGLKQFNLAIETGNPETLKKINKPLVSGVAETVISDIRKYKDVWIGSNFITGFYFETLDDIDQTLEYAASLDLDWRSFYSFQPLPGTDDFKSCVKNGYIKEWNIWGDGDAGSLVALSTENFTAEEVRQRNYSANLEVNFLNNPNLERNPKQAIRDFNYVLEMAPEHAFALYARSLAEQNLGDFEAAANSLKISKEIVERTRHRNKSKFQSNLAMTNVELNWLDYFTKFDTDILGAKIAIPPK